MRFTWLSAEDIEALALTHRVQKIDDREFSYSYKGRILACLVA
jgi:hypothetical protein